MYKSKQQVDNHVSAMLSRIRDEREKSSRGFAIARLYHGVKEYDTARKYLALFLNVEDGYAPAHRLMGELLEASSTGPGHTASKTDLEKAIAYYKRSYELDGQQKDLVKKICSLYARGDFDKQQFQYWVDKADVFFPKDSVVFSFKEKLLGPGSHNGAAGSPSGTVFSATAGVSQLETLLINELSERPDDVQLSYRLLQLYERTQQRAAAYRHVLSVLQRGCLDLQQYQAHYDWLTCAVQHLEVYCLVGEGSSCAAAWKVYFTLLMVLCELSLKSRTVTDSAAVIRRLDSSLVHASFSRLLASVSSLDALRQELEAQLHYFLAVVALKRNGKDSTAQQLQQQANVTAAGALLLASRVVGELKPDDLRATGSESRVVTGKSKLSVEQDTNGELRAVDLLANRSCCRKIYTVNLLIRIMKDPEMRHQLNKVRQHYVSPTARKELLAALLGEVPPILASPQTPRSRGGVTALSGSMAVVQLPSAFVGSVLLDSCSTQSLSDDTLPVMEDELDTLLSSERAMAALGRNLHNLIWLALQQYGDSSSQPLSPTDMEAQPAYIFMRPVLSGLPSGMLTGCFETGEPESLCRLDAEVFFYIAVRTAALKTRALDLELGRKGSDVRPSWQLPPELVPDLCSQEQADWWYAVHTFCSSPGSRWRNGNVRYDVPRLRRTVQRGIETVRLAIAGAFNVRLVVHVAKCLEQRFVEAEADESAVLTEDRASHLRAWANRYWEHALDLLGRLKRNVMLKTIKEPLFVQYDEQLTGDQVAALHDEVSACMVAAVEPAEDGDYVHVTAGDTADDEDFNGFDEMDAQHVSFATAMSQQEGDESFGRTPRTRGSPTLRGRSMNSTLVSSSSAERRPAAWSRGSSGSTHAIRSLEGRMQALTTAVDGRLKAIEDEQRALTNRSGNVLDELHAVREAQQLLAAQNAKMPDFVTADIRAIKDDVRALRDEQRSQSTRGADVGSELRWLKEEQHTLASRSADVADQVRAVKDDQRALMMKSSELAGELRSLKTLLEDVRSDLRKLPVQAAPPSVPYSLPPQQPPGPVCGGLPVLPLMGAQPVTAAPTAVGQQQQPKMPPQPFFPSLLGFAQPPVVPPFMQLGTYPHVESSIGKMKVSTSGRGFASDRSPRVGEQEEEASGEDYNEDEYTGHGGAGWDDEDDRGAASEQIYFNDTADDGLYVAEPQYEQDSDDKLVQQWPYGADAGVEGKHTVSYKPKTATPAVELAAATAQPQRPMPPPGYLAPPTTASAAGTDKSIAAEHNAMPPNVVLGKHFQPSESPAALLKNPVPAPPLVVQVPRGGGLAGSGATTRQLQSGVAGASSSGSGASSALAPQSSATVVASPTARATTAPLSAIGALAPTTQSFSLFKTSSATVTGRSRIDSGPADVDDEEGANVSSSSHDPHYDPIIDLPPEVDVVTGEESENVAFEARAKLFRLAGGEWKERGTGLIKVLLSAAAANDDSSQKARIVMRRDQTHKVCANHFILPGMELKPMEGSATSWVWKAIDFADERSEETFAIRFKTIEIAHDFKKAFAETQQKAAASKRSAVSENCGKSATATISATDSKLKSLSEQFKPAVGSWECSGCLLRNAAALVKCSACGTGKPGATASSAAPASAVSSPLANLLDTNFGPQKPALASATTTANVSAPSTSIVSSSCGKSASAAAPLAAGVSFGGFTAPSFGGGFSADSSAQPTLPQLFGVTPVQPVASSQQKPLFGGLVTGGVLPAAAGEAAAPAPGVQKPLFGGAPTANVPATPGASTSLLFGVQTSAPSTGLLFGVQPPAPSTGLLFGAQPPAAGLVAGSQKQPPLFGLPTAADGASGATPGKTTTSAESAAVVLSTAPSSSSGTPGPAQTPKSSTSGSIIGQLLVQPVGAAFGRLGGTESGTTGSVTDATKPGIFQGFTFNTPSSSLAPQPSVFPPTMPPAFTFGGIAAQRPQKPGSDSTSDALLHRAATGESQQQRSRAISEGEKSDGNVSVEEFEPQVDFKPVIPLPELVEVKTGEEDEEVMFAERARLYRFDKATNQWKERGVGVLKILRSAAQQQQYRVVMRRDQVHKLCANHLLSADMELTPMQGNTKAWCWFASDFSEGSVCNEQLAARFNSEELAERFKSVVVECCKNLTQNISGCRASGKPGTPTTGASAIAPNAADVTAASTGDKAAGGNVASVAAQSKPAATAQQPSLAELLKPPAGTWSCETCMVSNSGSVQRCACCQTLRPGATPTSAGAQDVKPAQSSAASSGIRFGGQSTSSFGGQSTSLFGSQPTAPLFGGQTTAVRFGTQSTTTPASTTTPGLFAPVTTATNEAPLFGNVSSSGSQTKSFVFGGQHGSTVASTGGFTFGLSKGPLAEGAVAAPDKGAGRCAASNSGSGQQQPTTWMSPIGRPRATSTDQEPTSPDLYVNESGEDDHINFAPVVQLPENVELATGEENEDVLYVHRAKLFRFTNGEWKERGIGDVKLLRHCQSKRVRIVMRREQILKLCLNHYVTASLELLPMAGSEGKSYIWSAMDFAEGEGVIQQFALRFKDASVASEFKRAFDDAKLPQGSQLPPIGTSTPSVPHQPTARVGTDSASKDSGCGSVVSTPSSARAAAAALFGAARMQSPSTSVFGTPSLGGSSPLSCLPNRRIADQFDEDGDVLFVSEEKPSAEQVQKARQFRLPDSFYLYENRSPCPGCVGCEDREEAYLDRLFRGLRPHGDAYAEHQSAVAPAPTASTQAPSQSASAGQTAQLHADTAKGACEAASAVSDGHLSNSMFNSQALSLSFSALASAAAAAASSSSGKPFGSSSVGFGGVGLGKTWAGAGTTLFGSQNKQPSKNEKAGNNNDDEDEEEDENPEQSADDIHFKPVLEKLPDLIDVKTGEESEVVEFCQRCKLYRFDAPSTQAAPSGTASTSQSVTSQWKERGVGEIKLLRDPTTGAVRVVMRRDQVLKLACNHRLTSDMELCPLATSEQAWCWKAMDYSENVLKPEQFAARFKTIALAKEFKLAFERCKAALGTPCPQSAAPAGTSIGEAVELVTSCGISASCLDSLSSEVRSAAAETSAAACTLFEKRCTAIELKDGSSQSLGMGTIIVSSASRNSNDSFLVQLLKENDDGEQSIIVQGRLAINAVPQKGSKKSSRSITLNTAVAVRNIQLDFSSLAAAEELDALFTSR